MCVLISCPYIVKLISTWHAWSPHSPVQPHNTCTSSIITAFWHFPFYTYSHSFIQRSNKLFFSIDPDFHPYILFCIDKDNDQSLHAFHQRFLTVEMELSMIQKQLGTTRYRFHIPYQRGWRNCHPKLFYMSAFWSFKNDKVNHLPFCHLVARSVLPDTWNKNKIEMFLLIIFHNLDR